MIIETQLFRIYRCRVYIKTDLARHEKIEAKAFSLASLHDVDLETFQGCPAAEPYLEASSENLTKMSKWRKGMKAYLCRFKNVTYR